MFFRQALTGMMQLFAVFAFFSMGFVCVCLPFSPSLRYRLVHVLLEEMDLLVWTGLGFFLLTLLFTLGFYAVSKGRLLLLKMGDLTTEIDIKVLKKAIPSVLYKQFASRVLLTDVEVFKDRNLRFSLSLAPMEEKEKEKVLLSIECQLETLLSERFGYNRPFIVQLKEF